MIIGFGNNVVSSLAADITASQTTIQVMPGTGARFAGLLSADYANSSNNQPVYAKITLTDAKETVFEICHLTSVSNDILTVVRAQEGTAPKGWSLNDVIANFATRGSENQFVQIEQLQSGHYISGIAGGTANALTLELPATYFVNGGTDWTLRTPIVVYPTQNNTGASTLQLTMGGRVLGTFSLYKGNRAELVAGDILKDAGLVCLLDKTKTFFNVMNPGAIYAGLGTAAFRDVQTSKNDMTPGRVLVNGSAVAVMDAIAKASGGSVTDANNLPSNTVSFVYSDAQNSPGFESSLLDFTGLGGGYNVQLAASYARSGLVKLRTKNGDVNTWGKWTTFYTTDNKPTPADVGAVPAAGGSVGYLNNAAHYAIKPGTWEGAGAFANQLGDPRAPFAIPMMTAPAGQSTYYPMIKSSMQTQGLGYQLASSLGVLVNGNATFPSIAIHGITDAGSGGYWIFDPNNGSFNSSGAINEAGHRVYSPLNPPPKQDLSSYMVRDWATVAGFVANNAGDPYIRHAESDAVVQLAPRSWVNSQLAVRDENINARATPEWVNQRISDVQNWTIQNFVTSMDLTAPFEVMFDGEWGWPRATDGAHVYNLNMVGGDRNRGVLVFRYQRFYRNGWIVLN